MLEPPEINKRRHDVKNRKVKIRQESAGRTRRHAICYNGTVKASKDEVRLFLEDKRERLKEIGRILSRVYSRSVQNREKD